jgi:hypothetical protein
MMEKFLMREELVRPGVAEEVVQRRREETIEDVLRDEEGRVENRKGLV